MPIPLCPKFGLIPSRSRGTSRTLPLLGVEQVLKIPSIQMTDLNTEGKALEAHELLLKISERIMQAITQGSLPTNVKDSTSIRWFQRVPCKDFAKPSNAHSKLSRERQSDDQPGPAD